MGFARLLLKVEFDFETKKKKKDRVKEEEGKEFNKQDSFASWLCVLLLVFVYGLSDFVSVLVVWERIRIWPIPKIL